MEASQVLKIRSDRKTALESTEGKLERQKQLLNYQIENYLNLFESSIENLLQDYSSSYSTNTALFLRVFRGPRFMLDFLHYPDAETQALLKQFDLEVPFRTLQKRMLKRGFYLLDESDTNKSQGVHINLWFQKPNHYGKIQLDHGYNVVPE